MKIGDKVRFLSETGGGTVAGFQGKNIVLVEDEDGFQIPTSITDVVVIGEESYDIGRVVGAGKSSNSQKAQNEGRGAEKNRSSIRPSASSFAENDEDISDKPVTFRPPAVERKGGDQLSVFLAFVPVNPHEMTRTRFEAYLVNDCNYYLRFVYLVAEGQAWNVRAEGEVEPNTKLFLEEFGREDLNDMEHVAIQLFAYKRERPFILKTPVSIDLRIDPVKFYKLHTFRENDFFEQTAMLMTIIENDRLARPLVIDANKLKEQMYASSQQGVAPVDKTFVQKPLKGAVPMGERDSRRTIIKHRGDEDVMVVDLHASEILESTAGMKPVDILNYQLDIFRRTLTEHAHRKGQRIVFIHGKGEGVLRSAIVHELQYRFKGYTYQDASFQEYGYGATQVTIR